MEMFIVLNTLWDLSLDISVFKHNEYVNELKIYKVNNANGT